MASNADYLQRNRVEAADRLKRNHALEAVSLLANNLGFLCSGDRLAEASGDIELFHTAVNAYGRDELYRRCHGDFAYAQRIDQGSDLDPLEIDLLYSLLNGLLVMRLAAEASNIEQLVDTEIVHGVAQILSSRNDAETSERRMVGNDPIYCRCAVLLDTIDMLN
ncbi:MAG: hypothetical protein AAFZ01_08045 [Pseudomonadota bacterium]